jgi:hypothetical protein
MPVRISRSRTMTRVPRRRTVWSRGNIQAFSLTGGVAVRQIMDSGLVAALAGNSAVGCTLLRTHIHLQVFSTTGASNVVRLGCVLEDEGSPPVTATSGPLTKPDRDWFAMISQVPNGTLAGTGFNITTNRMNDYDFKSRRLIRDPQVRTVWYMESAISCSATVVWDCLFALP